VGLGIQLVLLLGPTASSTPTESRSAVSIDGPFPKAAEPVADATEQQSLSDRDQTTADADQTGADFDQTFSDIDQSAANRDQRAADRDQAASDRDQADADRSRKRKSESVWEDTRRTRSQTSIDRDISSQARRESSRARDTMAELRDREAEARDTNATARDELASSLDAEMVQLERSDTEGENGSPVLFAQALRRRRAAEVRDRSAQARIDSAHDRKAARSDRARAAHDRGVAQAELKLEGSDHLTGALRRHSGLRVLQRELERTRRTHESLMLAFVDVDGLKAVNEEHGQAYGDALLCGVVECVTRVLRPYDVIIRFGGDEFACALCGQNLPGLQNRFAQAAAELSQRYDGAGITVGLAQAGPEERPEQLIARAEHAMIATRRERAPSLWD
jgi:diguanylate cyclase (GGDEF)-like protein